MNKKPKNVVIYLSLLFVVLLVGYFLFFNKSSQTSQPGMSNNQPTNQNMIIPNTLQVIDEVVGTGTVAHAGDLVTVNYVGTFTNGTKFDSSYDRNQPFQFTLGAGDVIKGWDQGILDMRVGGKRKLIVPPSLGYGNNDYGPIPGNSTLLFEVELLQVQAPQ